MSLRISTLYVQVSDAFVFVSYSQSCGTSFATEGTMNETPSNGLLFDIKYAGCHAIEMLVQIFAPLVIESNTFRLVGALKNAYVSSVALFSGTQTDLRWLESNDVFVQQELSLYKSLTPWHGLAWPSGMNRIPSDDAGSPEHNEDMFDGSKVSMSGLQH